jgi:hypothetical protein
LIHQLFWALQVASGCIQPLIFSPMGGRCIFHWRGANAPSGGAIGVVLAGQLHRAHPADLTWKKSVEASLGKRCSELVRLGDSQTFLESRLGQLRSDWTLLSKRESLDDASLFDRRTDTNQHFNDLPML